MADQTTEVTLKLNVQTGDGAKAMKDLASGTKEAGKEAKQTQQEFNALAEAQKRMAAQDRERQIKAQMERLRPTAPTMFDPHAQARESIQAAERTRQIDHARQQIERERQQSLPWYARSAGSLGGIGESALRAAPLIGTAYMAGHVVSAAGSAARDVGELAAHRAMTTGGSVSEGEAAALFQRNIAESIPVLGSFIKTMREAAGSLSSVGATSQMAIAGLSVLGRQMLAQRAEMSGQAQRAQVLYGLNVHAGDAQATANASAAYSASLTPGRLAGYRGPFGGALESIDQSAAQVAATREQLTAREHEHAATLGRINRTRAGATDATRVADDLQKRADRAQAVLAERLRNYSGQHPIWRQGITNAATDTTKEAQAAQGLAIEKNKQLGEQLAISQRQIADIEQKRVDLAKAELGQAQALLAVKGQIAQGAQGRAMQYGMGTPAEASEDAMLLRTIKRHGIGALSPDQIARAQSIPGAAEILDPMIRRRGDQIGQPVREALADLAPPGLRDQIRKPWSEQQDEVRKLQAEQRATSDQKQAAASKDFTVAVGEAVTEAIKLTTEQVKREIKKQVNDQILMNKGN